MKVKRSFADIIRSLITAAFCICCIAGGIYSYRAGNTIDIPEVFYSDSPVEYHTVYGSQVSSEEFTEFDYNDVSGEASDPEGNIHSKININTATADELEMLAGIGPSKSAAIVEYRNTYGGFVSIEEIMEVKGIGEATFNKIRDSICVR